MKQQASSGITGVEVLIEDLEVDLLAVEFGGNLAQVQRRAGEPVQARDHERIAFPDIFQTRVLRKNSILIPLDVASPNHDNREERPPVSEENLDDDSSHALDSSPRAAQLYAADAAGRLRVLLHALPALTRSPCRGKSFSAQAVGPVSGTLDHTSARHRCHPSHHDLARPLVRLAPRAGPCPTRDVDPLASPGIPAVLALDLPSWTATDPYALQARVRRMARENPTWGEEQIANELMLKLGLRVSPRTVRKYLPERSGQWSRQRVLPALADVCAQSCPGDRRL